MSIEISFVLTDKDVEHFVKLAEEAQSAFSDSKEGEDEIIKATTELLDTANEQNDLPEFIANRLTTLQVLINMVTDKDWNLDEEDKKRVIVAMAYFQQPDDLIPDKIPGIGFLDDAIMIEIIERELDPEIATYRDFCQYRIAETNRRKNLDMPADVTLDDWVADKRATLLNRMRERRKRHVSSGMVRIFRV